MRHVQMGSSRDFIHLYGGMGNAAAGFRECGFEAESLDRSHSALIERHFQSMRKILI